MIRQLLIAPVIFGFGAGLAIHIARYTDGYVSFLFVCFLVVIARRVSNWVEYGH